MDDTALPGLLSEPIMWLCCAAVIFCCVPWRNRARLGSNALQAQNPFICLSMLNHAQQKKLRSSLGRLVCKLNHDETSVRT